VISAGDDHLLIYWNTVTQEINQTVELPSSLFPTDLDCCPKSSTSLTRASTMTDLFAIAASDGKYYLLSRSGKIEKSIEAHVGAVLAIRWSYDGSAIASSGEDGDVKIWSKSGMLRSTLVSYSLPIYCVDWSPKSTHLVFTIDCHLEIKPLAPNSKSIRWKAHDALILKICWNQNTSKLYSVSEDCRYKVWDSNGRLIFISSVHDFPFTSIATSPDGSFFALGSFNTLKLCDSAGWSYSLSKLSVQSLFNLSWSHDSTQVAGASASGYIVFAHVIEKHIEWSFFEVTTSRKVIKVENILTNFEEEYEFRENIIQLSMQFGYLIVITTSQCYIYKVTNWNSPHVFDLKDSYISFVLQSDRSFLLIGSSSLNLYSYEGRHIATLKWIGLQYDFLNTSTISLSCDSLAAIDANDARELHFIDTQLGKAILNNNQNVKHSIEITCLALDQLGPIANRKCAFIDKNFDLYLTLVQPSYLYFLQTVKCSSMIKCILWNDESNILAGIQMNGRLMIWTYPHAAFLDKELLSIALLEKSSNEYVHKNPHLISFQGSRINLRRSDGSLQSASINLFVCKLHSYVTQSKWSEALGLCRYLKDSPDSKIIWATLAGMALHRRNLDIAELAYAEIDKIDKVFYIQKIKRLTNKEIRNAEVALICNNFREAEAKLISAGYILRAILLNLEMYNWDQAFELYSKYDLEKRYSTVLLYFREKYLKRFDKFEDNKAFKSLSQELEPNFDRSSVEALIQDPYKEKVTAK